MTKKEAKGLSLQAWRYLRDHPDIEEKEQLPRSIYYKIKGMCCMCPLCVLYRTDFGACMEECPLLASGEECQDPNSVYSGWIEPDIDAKTRGQCAARIVQIIEAWEV